MISKDKLKKTIVCYWSAEFETYVAESALMPHVITGTGHTVNEALKSFDKTLENVYDEIEADNVAGYKMGRPAKGYVQFNTNIRPSSKYTITKLADELGISQGEVVDYLVFFRECKLQENAKAPKETDLAKEIRLLKEQIRSLSIQLEKNAFLQKDKTDQLKTRQVHEKPEQEYNYKSKRKK